MSKRVNCIRCGKERSHAKKKESGLCRACFREMKGWKKSEGPRRAVDKNGCLICGKALNYGNTTGYCNKHFCEVVSNKINMARWISDRKGICEVCGLDYQEHPYCQECTILIGSGHEEAVLYPLDGKMVCGACLKAYRKEEYCLSVS